jgi:hypothetical protein
LRHAEADQTPKELPYLPFRFGFVAASQAPVQKRVACVTSALPCPVALARPAIALAPLSHMLRNGFFLVHGFVTSALRRFARRLRSAHCNAAAGQKIRFSDTAAKIPALQQTPPARVNHQLRQGDKQGANRMRVAISVSLLLTLAAAPAWCQPAPRASAAKTHPAPVHHRHRQHRARLAKHTPAPPPVPVTARPDPDALAPAPMPNADITPPQRILPPNQPSLDPGNLQLHYPDIGNGYLPYSSSDYGDNERAPIVPGMSVVVPLTQTPPPLPPAHPTPP